MCVFCKQKTAYEMRISGSSSDVCSSDLNDCRLGQAEVGGRMREELATGGIHAVSAPSEINLVQIKLKDLLLGEFAFQGQRQNHFPELAGEAVAVVEKYVAVDLLRNCGGALHPTARTAIFDGKPNREDRKRG